MTTPDAAPVPVNLALQGGGSHGAFTWGVLDRLLEDGRVRIAAISGASAGAMNAVVLAQGWREGGAHGARLALARFWRRVAQAAAASPVRRSPMAALAGTWSLESSPGYLFVDLLSRVASPYDLNPLDMNPLRDLVGEMVDFEKARACAEIGLHVSATDVETGRVRVFDRREITLDVVMASACVPTVFKAVEIGGRHYWDGGFMGNPVLFPLYERSEADDIILVQINPIARPGVPRTARDIADRVNEITFNSALMKDLRAIEFVQRLHDAGRLEGAGYRNPRLHMVEARKALRPLGASSKLNAEWPFLEHLFRIGRGAASGWLHRHGRDLGVRQTVDLRRLFQGENGDARPLDPVDDRDHGPEP